MNDHRPVALITGASRGIGRGIALALAGCGYDIAGGSRVVDPQAMASAIFAVKQQVESTGARFLPVAGDVANLAGMSDGAKPERSDSDALGAALDRLPVDQRTIVVLHHLEGHDLAGLAEILGIPIGTVKSRLHSARQALQAALAAEDRAR